MQTEFAERVGHPHGLERGIEGSRAKHQTVRQFYAGIEAEAKQPRLTADALAPRTVGKGMFTSKVESTEAVAARLTQVIHDHYAPQLAVAGNAKADRKRTAELSRTAKAQAAQLARAAPTLNMVAGLTPAQLAEVVEMTNRHRLQNAIVAEAQRRADQLAVLVKNSMGAVHTFARKALDAIARAGEWRRVDWREIEKDTVHESVHEHGQSRVSAFRAVLEHSPGQADVTEQQANAVLKRAAVGDKEAGLKAEPERFRPG
jgi:hypothetical protein